MSLILSSAVLAPRLASSIPCKPDDFFKYCDPSLLNRLKSLLLCIPTYVIFVRDPTAVGELTALHQTPSW